LPSTSTRRKKARDGPLKKPLIKISVKRRRSTLYDINGGTNANLIPSTRKRQISSATAIGFSSLEANGPVLQPATSATSYAARRTFDVFQTLAAQLHLATNSHAPVCHEAGRQVGVKQWLYRRGATSQILEDK
jgi:hypothetical protein